MKNKDLIYNTLLELQSDDGIDTSTLSNLTNISRANVSHELNCLCKEGKIYKTSSRPVKFFINSPKIKKHIKSALDKLSQNNISMNSAIEQAKASILYPPKGINCNLEKQELINNLCHNRRSFLCFTSNLYP